MIICPSEFDLPDRDNPKYSMAEVDYYSHIPYGCGLPQHRLSLRKNLETGEFELYRRYYKTRLFSRKDLTMLTQDDTGLEEVVISGTLQEVIDYAEKEVDRHWFPVFGRHKEKDQICQHKYPVKATFCKVKETTQQ